MTLKLTNPEMKDLYNMIRYIITKCNLHDLISISDAEKYRAWLDKISDIYMEKEGYCMTFTPSDVHLIKTSFDKIDDLYHARKISNIEMDIRAYFDSVDVSEDEPKWDTGNAWDSSVDDISF